MSLLTSSPTKFDCRRRGHETLTLPVSRRQFPVSSVRLPGLLKNFPKLLPETLLQRMKPGITEHDCAAIWPRFGLFDQFSTGWICQNIETDCSVPMPQALKKIAHGFNRGLMTENNQAPDGAAECIIRLTNLSPHPGLCSLPRQYPQLKLWAIFGRSSAAALAEFRVK